MKEKLRSDLSLKFLSVVLAFILWLFVINVDNPVVTRSFSNVPVDMLNEQVLDELNQTYKIKSGKTVSFSVRGKKSIVDSLKKSDFKATADVSTMSRVHAILIKVEPLRNKEQLDVDAAGATVKVSLEDLKNDQIPVVIKVKGKPADGYEVSQKTATPNLVSVSGPKSIVSRVKNIGVTVEVDGFKDNISVRRPLICYDEDGDVISQDRIKFDSNSIRVKVELTRVKQVPVRVRTKGTPAKGYVLGSVSHDPMTISVTGNQDDLDKIDEILLEPLDIADSTKSVEKTIKIEELKLPDGITVTTSAMKKENIVVRANVEKQKNRTLYLQTDQIHLVDNTKNYMVTYDKTIIPVKISGLKSVVDKVEAKDLNPKINMKLYQKGTHTVQIHLTPMDNMTIKKNVTAKIIVK